jgi:hypothetical protein
MSFLNINLNKGDIKMDRQYYVVYETWDSTGSSPAAYKNFVSEIELSNFLQELDEAKRNKGLKYKIILIVYGDRIEATPNHAFNFKTMTE